MASIDQNDSSSELQPPPTPERSFQDEGSDGNDVGWATEEEKPKRKRLHHEPNIEKGSSYRLSENVGPDDLDPKQLIVAIICCLFVAALGVAIGIVIKNNTAEKANAVDEVSMETMEPTSALPECEKMMQNFTSNSLVLTMTVADSYSDVELQYAANVFEKTYMGMLQNKLDGVDSGYCDPWCRSITNLEVSSNEVLLSGEEAAVTAKQATGCEMMLELTFSLEGTYWGCEDEEFPGLFSPDTGARQLKTTQNFLRKPSPPRFLEEEYDECPVCPEDSSTTGLTAPTSESLLELMNPYVAVLPAVCELTSAKIVENSS